MSRIDDLIERLCPHGVPIRPLASIGTLNRGRRFVKSDIVDQGTPCIHYGEIYTRYGTSAREAFSFLVPEQAAKLRTADPGDVVIASAGETVEDIGKAVAWLGDEPVVIHDACYAYKSDIDPKFVAYFLRTSEFRTQVRRFISSSKISAVSLDNLGKVRIPVLPLEVQREIVRILDHFSSLEAELEAELEARRRQYEHYAHAMLESTSDIPRVRLGDVATIVRGASPRPIRSFITQNDDGIPWIKIGDVPAGGKYITGTAQRVSPAGAAKSRRVHTGDFVLSNSMSFGRPYISKIDGCIHDGWLAISEFDESFVPDYLYYLLRSSPVQAEFERRAGAGTVKNLNADIVKSVSVPLPSRERQRQVVELLDRFDALVNDPSVGLPAELAARRKQYEHYRDRLLTFEERPA